ncbi:hypothetical protein FB45DRAFT_901322 [Roridomyces roridus]|uniref:Tat pathway signal sequence n=1 Tax=Roridomyces roridus TaxID=1738132 RepID=A0AAD7C8F5_9AGAR|nr:hypothetical protein FB45DRAFT_901322 [Roridomyces roridus]
MSARFDYTPLDTEDAESQKVHGQRNYAQPPPEIPSRRVLYIILLCETLLLLVISIRWLQATQSCHPTLLYSPAQDAVEYGITSYAITGEDARFHIPPSPSLDAAWDNLYNFGVTQIPKSKARLLPNKTAAIPGDESNYIIELDVFHNLHCLNMVRKALHPEHYAGPEIMPLSHLDHCVDWMRQSLMCAGDTSAVVWQWDPVQNITTFQGSVAHTCRNFDKLREWAKENEIQRRFDNSVRMGDDGIEIGVIPKDFTLQ